MKPKLTTLIFLFTTALTLFIYLGQIKENMASFTAISPTFSNAQLAINNPQRDQIYLNGIWQFAPAVGQAQQPPTNGWGKIYVPGDWQQENHPSIPGIISKGEQLFWQNFDGKKLSKAWYQTNLIIPQNWQGRAIFLDLARVSTDATIFINNNLCGQIDWPGGSVDLTDCLKTWEKEINLSILVTAVADSKDKSVIMGPNEIYTTESKLDSRGLIGEVRLFSMPQGARINDVFIQTSTRNQQIKLDVELANINQAGEVSIIGEMLDEKEQIEKQFNTNIKVTSQPNQTTTITWNWSNPRLWDVGKPNIYTLRLRVKGKDINDVYDQPFGFREFWIEGRKFYLNGKEIRLRPVLFDESWATGMPIVADRVIDGYFWAGFNIAELWPWNHNERGRWHFRELLAERADIKGFPIIMPALDMGRIALTGKWNEQSNNWENFMAKELRRYRNHPAILMWGNSPNFFGYNDDQNPRRIGKKEIIGTIGPSAEASGFPQKKNIGEDAVNRIKKYDPTRPVMIHQGANVGDIYALNSYLNMIPLQERESWLSDWAKSGNMPYMVVEFGTPLHTTMMRGRNRFRGAIVSEPLMTEYSAIYFGKEAYQLETFAYRQKINQLFMQDQTYKSWHLKPELDFAPAFQKLQYLFSTNTWRSWRTFGISGGMIPWQQGHGWQAINNKETINTPIFQSGNRGTYLPQVSKSLWYHLQPEGNIIHPAGQAIMANNRETLAWIGGGKIDPKSESIDEGFVTKDHSFYPGEKIKKQLIIINDNRTKQPFSYKWLIVVNDKQIASGKDIGTIETGTTLFVPITADLPNVNHKTDATIIMEASIGNNRHDDSFSFRIFPKINDSKVNNISIFDPVGKTSKLLLELGYKLVPWNGENTDALLVIGREVLSQGHQLPGNLENFVKSGGKAIIFTQNPAWLNDHGWRISPHLSRRVFSINNNHPIVTNLDDFDLRDWRGESTLIEAYPDTTKTLPKLSPYGQPYYGFHWGNSGALTSANIEKPHFSSWRPILESEFDLAYTPLMELNYGNGRLIWNTLDLEDHAPLDGAATQLTKQIIDYAVTTPLAIKLDTVNLIGNNDDATQLDAMGLIYQKTNSITQDAGLIIVGSTMNLPDNEIRKYLENGGKMLFLPRHAAGEILGVKFGQVESFGGSLNVPKWSEVEGISMSDIRARSFYNTWLIKSGGEIAADGLLSRVKIGKGIAIFSQIDPSALNADQQTYLRLTRWRYTRAQAQILANLGASFKADTNVFNLSGKSEKLYHPDYRTEFDLADDPYRYYRW